MKKSFFIVGLVALSLVTGFVATHDAKADGFGITPPYVNNNSLTQSSRYEQTIILVRSNPKEDLTAKITVNVPGADSWISIDRGTQFTMPAGTQQMPIIVSVNVPGDAKLGRYLGNIRIVVSPLQGPASGTVGVEIGAQIDVNLQVIDKKMADFKVRRVVMTNAEVGSSFWWMHFPGKVLFTMDIQNDGNIEASPDKVVFTYGEYRTQKTLETETNTNRLDSVKPFQSKRVVAEMPTYLPVGSYKVFYTIYGRDDNDLIGSGQLDLSILPPGTLTAYQGYGFWGIRWQEKFITFGLIFLIILILYVLGLWVRSGFRNPFRRRRNRSVLAPPPPPPRY